MITLRTLSQATEQQVFDQVATHLLEQNQQSLDGKEGCVYRGAAGLKCAAGCLIGDDEYKREFENRGWSILAHEGQVPKEHKDLIMRLQRIHDGAPVETWEKRLIQLAEGFNLEFKSSCE